MSIFKRRKKEQKPEQEQEQVTQGSPIDYKGWIIVPMISYLANEPDYVMCVIRSNEIKKAFKIRKKVNTEEVTHYHTFSSVWGSRTEEWHHKYREEMPALQDIVTEAKVIVDMFAEMQEFYKNKAVGDAERAVKSIIEINNVFNKKGELELL